MADWVKIALKTTLVALVMVALWIVFTKIEIPAIDFSIITDNIGFVFAFLAYICPAFTVIWNTTLLMGGMLIALWTFRFSMVAIRWLFKVNE